MKVLKGYNYAATSNEAVTITDSNGLVLCELEGGKQGYFTATTDEIDLGSSEVVITQIRGNFNMPITAGSGGGQTFPEGAIVGIGPDGAYMDLASVLKVVLNESRHETSIAIDSSITDWYGDLSIVDGGQLFTYYTNLKSWHGNLSNMTKANQKDYTGWNYYGMFEGCSALTSFEGDLSSLTDGRNMFQDCTSLTTWNTDLPSLTNGAAMFYGCTSLTTWNTDLPSLTNGDAMFYGCTSLTSFEVDLPSLTTGDQMFSECKSLTSFKGDLSSVTNGTQMFVNCTSLTSFEGDLSSLTSGTNMFFNCKLNKASVERIVNSVPTYTDGSSHSITIHCDKNEVTDADIGVYSPTLRGKGWNPSFYRK